GPAPQGAHGVAMEQAAQTAASPSQTGVQGASAPGLARAPKKPPTPAPDPELSFDFDGQTQTFGGVDRQNWRKAREAGKKATMSEGMGFDVDEPNAVGQKGIKKGKAYRRATSAQNRQLLDPVTNRISKRTGTEVPIGKAKGAPPRAPVSVVDNPSALMTHRFSEVNELND